jgi:hypothetical protein
MLLCLDHPGKVATQKNWNSQPIVPLFFSKSKHAVPFVASAVCDVQVTFF